MFCPKRLCVIGVTRPLRNTSGKFKSTTSLSKNYNLIHLQNMTKERLVYRVMKLQRLLDSYQLMCDPLYVCGKDKLRVDHPDPDEIVTGRMSMRKIALKIMYLGWNYAGYAWEDRSWAQTNAGHTNVVERVVLEALLRQQLLPLIGSTKEMCLNRSGRTDREVSGLSQVFTLRVRSNLTKGYGVWQYENDRHRKETFGDDSNRIRSTTTYHEDGLSNSDISLDEGELSYVKLLNEALPMDMRVLAWAPVSKKFSPRYDCRRRTYRYVFTRGSLDIDLMNEAAQRLVGKHDFRNFCKKSEDNLFKHFEREIYSIEVENLQQSSELAECDLCSATITAHSFLHNQIRMMMSALVLVAGGHITTETIDDMLDITKTPRKPGYNQLTPHNLTLIDCVYDEDHLSWRWDDEALAESARFLSSRFSNHAVKAEILRHMYSDVGSRISDEKVRSGLPVSFDENLYGNVCDNPFIFDEDVSKTIEEKQETISRRQISAMLNKGSYRKAARLHRAKMTIASSSGE